MTRMLANINAWVVKNTLWVIGIIFLIKCAQSQVNGFMVSSGLYAIAAAIFLVGHRIDRRG